jgi:hypothetical protein
VTVEQLIRTALEDRAIGEWCDLEGLLAELMTVMSDREQPPRRGLDRRIKFGARRRNIEIRAGQTVFDARLEALVDMGWLREGHNIERARLDLTETYRMMMARLEAERDGQP